MKDTQAEYSVHMHRMSKDVEPGDFNFKEEENPSYFGKCSSFGEAVYMCACRPRAPMGDYWTLVLKHKEGAAPLGAVVGIVSVVEGGIGIPDAWWDDNADAKPAKKPRAATKRKKATS